MTLLPLFLASKANSCCPQKQQWKVLESELELELHEPQLPLHSLSFSQLELHMVGWKVHAQRQHPCVPAQAREVFLVVRQLALQGRDSLVFILDSTVELMEQGVLLVSVLFTLTR